MFEVSAIIQFIGNLFGQFLNSTFFGMIKFILFIYVAVLLADLFLLLFLRGLGSDYRAMKMGMDIPTVPKGKMQKKWVKIKERLGTKNTSQYKVAILEADKFADGILAGIGYKGENMGERLKQIKPGQLENVEELNRAHQVRNRIVYEKGFVVDKKLAEDVIGVYEGMLRNLEFI